MSTAAQNTTQVSVREELGRFFAIARQFSQTTGQPAWMPACPVDQYWHGLMQDDAAFAALVNEFVGEGAEIRHLEAKGHGPIEWVTMYEQAYGPLPSIWFETTNGRLQADEYAKYQAGRSVELSWDCTPGCPLPELSWDCTPG